MHLTEWSQTPYRARNRQAAEPSGRGDKSTGQSPESRREPRRRGQMITHATRAQRLLIGSACSPHARSATGSTDPASVVLRGGQQSSSGRRGPPGLYGVPSVPHDGTAWLFVAGRRWRRSNAACTPAPACRRREQRNGFEEPKSGHGAEEPRERMHGRGPTAEDRRQIHSASSRMSLSIAKWS